MEGQGKILIVEDELIIAANLSLQLNKMGYEVTGILTRGEDVLDHLKENKPDILLLDIRLKGDWDGIRAAEEVKKRFDLPIIFLTANADDAHFNRAKAAKPDAFISKPFKKLDLKRAIELTISRKEKSELGAHDSVAEQEDSIVLKDRIFVRHKEKMVRLFLDEIQFIAAERNYSRIYCCGKEYVLSVPLKTLERKINNPMFLRIHRSYMVNLARVDEVGEGHIVIDQKTLPLGQGQRTRLLARIQRI